MSEKQFEAGAGPALAAHSKDASVSGQTPASRATGNDAEPASSVSETVSRASEQAREAAGQIGSSVSNAARNTRQRLLGEADHAAEQAMEFVRDHPAVALTLSGAICFAAGVLLGRR